MSKVITIKDNNIESLSQGRVLIDFWADWCSPCKYMERPLKDLAKKHEDITVAKCDVDKNEELAEQFSVQSIPTLILLQDGKEIKRSVGAIPAKELKKFIKD